MTSNFWESTHAYQWLVDDVALVAARQRDLQFISSDDVVKIMLYYSNFVQKACKRLHVRQPVVGTALVYWRRFFTKNALYDIDPMLVAGTCIYVACKIEECPHHIRNVANEMRALGGDLFPYDATAIADFEFYLIEELEFSLIMFHPYKPLQLILEKLNLTKKCLQTAWYVVNDTFKTDLHLIYPPHMIAIAAIFIVTCIQDTESASKSRIPGAPIQDTSSRSIVMPFFIDLNVDMRDVLAITQRIFNLYDVWQEYSEEKIPELIDKFPKVPTLEMESGVAKSTLPTTPAKQPNKH
ncbi:hypothetical protein BDV3_006453 [Batrachochytrium dendrobatidis]|nr:RNA polymerase II holoenzyme cyclin-like subunit [Batrachochytrium dendrobatidis]KAK5668809.1 RNA polymerase II holoenzyme cyclin-like subunit [Batrachochytrium dendrobatidis]